MEEIENENVLVEEFDESDDVEHVTDEMGNP
jgi:hypothetical protein